MQENTPKIHAVNAWGGRLVKTRFSATKPQGILIHHTASPNRAVGVNPAAEQAAAFKLARQIQAYHIDKNRWKDSGQHFTISRGGVIMEGRTGTLAAIQGGKIITGAHSGDNEINATWFGIENEGTYLDKEQPKPGHWQALIELCAWLAFVGQFDTAHIKGHCEVRSTQCPGNLEGRLEELRAAAHARKLELMKLSEQSQS